MKGEPYIRKKGNKFIIEQKLDGKTKYIVTLPPMKKLMELIGVEASQYYQDPIEQSEVQSVKEEQASSSDYQS